MAKVVAKTGQLLTRTWEFSRPKLAKAWALSKVELRPPTPGEIPAIQNGIQDLMVSAKTGRFFKLTVKEAWLNTLVGVEVLFWFYAGECIGKGSLVGYEIPGATDWAIHLG